MESLFIFFGLAGVAINLVAYGLLTAGKLRANTLVYQWINIIGTTGILLSLIAQWNLPVFLGNIAWLVIALVGVARIMIKQKWSI
jgi:paired small multidrug resistance pump